jgi:ribosomal-protein-alanine N-acetyltransferase
MMPAMQLRASQLTLRFPAPGDAEALFALAGDPAVTRWFSWGPYRSVQEPAAWIAAQAARRDAGEQLDFVIDHTEHGPMVGTWLGRPYWGTGLNRESKALVAHAAFALCGLERLGAYSNPDNARSTRALEAVGFAHEGTLRAWHRHDDRQLDVHVFGLLREEWAAGPLRDIRIAAIGEPPPAWRLGA